jgi:hypothetical protein
MRAQQATWHCPAEQSTVPVGVYLNHDDLACLVWTYALCHHVCWFSWQPPSIASYCVLAMGHNLCAWAITSAHSGQPLAVLGPQLLNSPVVSHAAACSSITQSMIKVQTTARSRQ